VTDQLYFACEGELTTEGTENTGKTSMVSVVSVISVVNPCLSCGFVTF
jgi:hypothetical protein